MKVPGSKIVPCQGVLGSNHSLTFGLFTQVSGLGPLGPLVFWRVVVVGGGVGLAGRERMLYGLIKCTGYYSSSILC